MVDLRELAVPRGLNGGNWVIGITGNRQREDRAVKCIRATEGTDDHTCVDGLRNGKELDREILLGLDVDVHVSSLVDPTRFQTGAYQFHSGFSILLDCEGVRDIKASVGILQQQESLVWALCGASFLSG